MENTVLENINNEIDKAFTDSGNSKINPTQVKGWGIDADPKNDPTYPMRIRQNETEKGYTWERPEQQTVDVEVLHSNERPNVSATFGTANPPAGISGLIRREAFKYSESSYGHWLPLMLADRVEMVEGVASDLASGHIPNIFSEMGWKAEWKHSREKLVTKIIIGAAVAGLAWAILKPKNDDFESED